ncbi:hypothetical protein EON77_16810 [bacterium]|nr:MAG: hypothetical protein EON77_16810 [bacterium]
MLTPSAGPPVRSPKTTKLNPSSSAGSGRTTGLERLVKKRSADGATVGRAGLFGCAWREWIRFGVSEAGAVVGDSPRALSGASDRTARASVR